MARKTRLDVVVQLRERAEERATVTMAAAVRERYAADESLRASKERSRRDERRRGQAAEWQLSEAAHVRSLAEVRSAEETARLKAQLERAARAAHETAHKRAEAVRRAAAAKFADLVHNEESAERRSLDELATLMFAFFRQG
jgi:hypothetical protein